MRDGGSRSLRRTSSGCGGGRSSRSSGVGSEVILMKYETEAKDQKRRC